MWEWGWGDRLGLHVEVCFHVHVEGRFRFQLLRVKPINVATRIGGMCSWV